MKRGLLLLALFPVVLLAACGGGGDSSTTTSASGTTTGASDVTCSTVSAPSTEARTGKAPTTSLDPSKTYEVKMETNCGDFTITLDQKQSPKTTASFVALVNDGFYDKTVFHRIVPDFVIQGGDPLGTGSGGPGYSVDEKPPANLAYTKGTVAMAKSSAEPPGRSGSQFYVVTGADAGLPPEYALVGKVTEGLDVVERIGKLGTPAEKPKQPIVIEKMTIEHG